MKVYFRVDASIHIGTGHVMRCLSLAKEVQRNGHDVVFVMRPQVGDLCEYTKNLGFKVEKLPKLCKPVDPESDDDYQAWLQVPISKDVEEFLILAADADVIVIDHYGINIEWESHIRSIMPCKLVAIDDLVREHNVDLIIDQTYGAAASDYQALSTVSRVIVGSKYALLDTQFAKLHSLAANKKIDHEKHRILLTMGGVDKLNTTLKVLNGLSSLESKINTTVLLNKNAPHYKSIVSFCEKHQGWLRHIPFSGDMAALMLQHTIAIGAPGSTAWERACMGLPSLLVPIAENQRKIHQKLVSEKIALSLLIDEIPKLLSSKLTQLIQQYGEFRSKSLVICDGMGAKRVAIILESL